MHSIRSGISRSEPIRSSVRDSKPVWIRGVGWASDSPSLETRDWADAAYTRIAAEMAYRLAKVRRPATEIEVAEIDDRFSYKELQHVESLGLAKKGEAGKRVVRGDYGVDGRLPVNVSGGSLGCGNVFEATGLHRAAEVALQLRGDAGVRQLDGVRTGVAQSWRFIPSATGAVAAPACSARSRVGGTSPPASRTSSWW